MRRIVRIILMILLLTSCIQKEEAKFTIINNSINNIDSLKLFLMFSKDTVVIKDIKGRTSRTIILETSEQKIPPSVEAVNIFKYYISGQKHFGTWGVIDGAYSFQIDTIYVFDKGWIDTNDSTKLHSNKKRKHNKV